MDELRRLNNAFGIGVIWLDAEHFMQSEILFSAKEKDSLDWDTINRLIDDNRNFKSFLNDLMEDIKVGKVKSRYDRVYGKQAHAIDHRHSMNMCGTAGKERDNA